MNKWRRLPSGQSEMRRSGRARSSSVQGSLLQHVQSADQPRI